MVYSPFEDELSSEARTSVSKGQPGCLKSYATTLRLPRRKLQVLPSFLLPNAPGCSIPSA